jgi:hypothetical protein
VPSSTPAPQELAAIPARAPADVGSWADSPSYRFKVSDRKRCTEPAAAAGAAGSRQWLALSVEVFAKYDGLLVASRDVKLESGGIILASEAAPKVTAACGTLLRPRQLKRGETASGLVLFVVPPEFDTPAAVVSYQATRWGGAPRLEIKLPAPAISVALER